MDFGDSPDEASVPARASATGCATTTRVCRPRRPPTSTGRARPRWHQSLYDAGFFGMSWPKDIGGQELPSVYEVILDDELAAAGSAAAARASATWCRASSSTATTTSVDGSCPAS